MYNLVTAVIVDVTSYVNTKCVDWGFVFYIPNQHYYYLLSTDLVMFPTSRV
jgi:hypothetical protein